MLDNLQKQFYRLLRNTDLEPPPGAWDRIEKQLPQRPQRQPVYRYAAALLFLVSTSLGTFLVYNRYPDKSGGNPLARSKNVPGSNSHTVSRTETDKPGIPTGKRYTASLQKTSAINVTTSNTPGFVSSKKGSTYYPGRTESTKISATVYRTVSAAGSVDLLSSDTAAKSTPGSTTVPGNYLATRTDEVGRAGQSYLNQPQLLASVGRVPLHANPYRNKVLLALNHALAYPVENPMEEKVYDDPERTCKREKRLNQFKQFDVVRGFHLGAFISLTNSWMTRKQDYLDHPGNTIDPRTYVGMAFGINLGYDINERWGIQTELAIRNSKGQHFDEECIYTGSVAHKQLRLWYARFPVLVKYKLMQINRQHGRPIVLGVLAGPQINVLYKKQLLVNEEKAPLSNAFLNHVDIGVLSGLDLDFYLSKNFYLSAGTRLSLASPVKRHAPMSIQLGFMMQLNFRVPPKEKH